MGESVVELLRRMYFTEEKITEVVDALKQCVYRDDARCVYDLMAGGLSWKDEIPYEITWNGSAEDYERKINSMSDYEKRVNSLCSMYLRVIIAYRASLTKGKPIQELQEAWDDLKNKVSEWPGFREERIFSEETKRLLKKFEDSEFGYDT